MEKCVGYEIFLIKNRRMCNNLKKRIDTLFLMCFNG